ncbi:hypothetical protein [Streptomyces sp. NPDC005345]|uniref:hypothetical protein n=1 Tax=Streptomyces sp. NPDC005345 TaxID=3156877 RepID=UPI0033AF6F19
MPTRTTLAALGILALGVTGCTAETSSGTTDSKPSAKAPSSAPELTQKQRDDALANAGIPKEPTGADRKRLLDALAGAAPDVVRYEDKAVDAARNQCSAINGEAQRLDWSASQRFTYKDVTTSEVQGARINAALKATGFCKV